VSERPLCPVDENFATLQSADESSKVLLVLFGLPGEDEDASRYAKQKSSPRRSSSMKRWNVWVAMRKPKDMLGELE
jgi:hypothetical protein